MQIVTVFMNVKMFSGLSLEKSIAAFSIKELNHDSLAKVLSKKHQVAWLSGNLIATPTVPIRFDHFAFLTCRKGKATIRYGYKEEELSSLTVLVLLPNQLFEIVEATDDFEVQWLFFHQNALQSAGLATELLENLLRFEFVDKQGVILTEAISKQWGVVFGELGLELRENKPYQEALIDANIIKLILLTKRALVVQKQPTMVTRPQELYASFMSLIEKHFFQLKSVQAYADILRLTPKHLSETIKAITSSTALFFIHQRIVKEAMYLLVYTDATIEQIANTLNFDTVSHFGRFFKKYLAVPPSVYRANQRKSHMIVVS